MWICQIIMSTLSIPQFAISRGTLQNPAGYHPPPPGNSNLVTPGVNGTPGWVSVDNITAVAGLMKFPHSGFM